MSTFAKSTAIAILVCTSIFAFILSLAPADIARASTFNRTESVAKSTVDTMVVVIKFDSIF